MSEAKNSYTHRRCKPQPDFIFIYLWQVSVDMPSQTSLLWTVGGTKAFTTKNVLSHIHDHEKTKMVKICMVYHKISMQRKPIYSFWAEYSCYRYTASVTILRTMEQRSYIKVSMCFQSQNCVPPTIRWGSQISTMNFIISILCPISWIKQLTLITCTG